MATGNEGQADRIVSSMTNKESSRLSKLFDGAIQDKPSPSSSSSSPSSSRPANASTFEEKRLAAHYLPTENQTPPKPKYKDHTSPSTSTPSRDLPTLHINRPSIKPPNEMEKMISSGLSEEEMIAIKKRELAAKLYQKKKKEQAKDLGKWKEKDAENARKEAEAIERRAAYERTERERAEQLIQERRLAELQYQNERENAIRLESARLAAADAAAAKKLYEERRAEDERYQRERDEAIRAESARLAAGDEAAAQRLYEERRAADARFQQDRENSMRAESARLAAGEAAKPAASSGDSARVLTADEQAKRKREEARLKGHWL